MIGMLPRPSVAPAQRWRFPEPVRAQLPNGARVWLYHLPGQHVLSAQVVFDVPTSVEPAELEGIATIAVRTSDEGSRTHPGAELAELLENQGATYSGTALGPATICRMEVPASRLPGALDLLAEIITQPAFDDSDVARQVALRLAEIQQGLVHSQHLAALGFQRAVIDPSTRAGRPTAGVSGTVAAITSDDVAGFHRHWWRPAAATIVLAGDLPTSTLELVANGFAGWQGGQTAGHQPFRVNPAAPQVWVIDRPEAVQTDIRIGCAGPDRNDPRWAALDVAATAMGGSFGSRLNLVLREELGYTYGAHAGFHSLRSGGTFSVRTSCRTEIAPDAVARILELLDIQRRPFTADELSDARSYLLGIAPLHFQTAETIADQAAALAAAGVQPEWVNRHQSRVTEVTAATANRAFAAVVRPDRVSVVLCGQATGLLPGLTALGLDPQVISPQSLDG